MSAKDVPSTKATFLSMMNAAAVWDILELTVLASTSPAKKTKSIQQKNKPVSVLSATTLSMELAKDAV